MTILTPTAPSHVASQAHAASRRAWNFSAGPGVLAEDVIRQAQGDLWDIAGSGIGIMEHSHRGKVFDKVLAEAEEACRKVANIPANYKVMFLTGGATTQNFMIPANLLPDEGIAAYLTTGYWAEKSFEESKVYSSKCYEAWDGRPIKHTYCPSDTEIKYGPDRPAYVHMCSNNTIYGTQWRNADGSLRLPKVPDGVPLVCDMSSDIYSRPMDVSKFGLIYAGAQKNVGIAGTTLLILRDDLVKPVRKLPTMLKYETHAKDGSRHNTPPAFAIYLSGLVFKWILAQGGLAKMHEKNMDKAKLIYDAIDGSNGFFKGHARADSRSLMNILFKTPSTELDDKFIAEALKNGMDQLKGHRSTGGVRASAYNAMPRAGCEALALFMKDFAAKNG